MTRRALLEALLADELTLKLIAAQLQFTICLAEDHPTVTFYLREAVQSLVPQPEVAE